MAPVERTLIPSPYHSTNHFAGRQQVGGQEQGDKRFAGEWDFACPQQFRASAAHHKRGAWMAPAILLAGGSTTLTSDAWKMQVNMQR